MAGRPVGFSQMSNSDSKQIIDICKRLYDRGYVLARSGNVSIKLEGERVLITPSRLRKHSLRAEDLCIVNLEGEKLSGSLNPSSEYRVHCAIYKNRGDISAIVHAHPRYSIVSSLAAISFEYPILPETALSLGAIPTVPFSPPGSQKLADSLIPHLANHNAFILQRHGVVALGEDLEEAFDRLEEVEHVAKIAYSLSVKGRIPVLGRSQLMNTFNFAKSQGLPIPQIAIKFLHRLLSK